MRPRTASAGNATWRGQLRFEVGARDLALAARYPCRPYADHLRLVAISFVAGTRNRSAPFLRASASMSPIQISRWPHGGWSMSTAARAGSLEGRLAMPAVSGQPDGTAPLQGNRATRVSSEVRPAFKQQRAPMMAPFPIRDPYSGRFRIYS